MGRTGNQIKDLELRVDSLESRVRYLENLSNRNFSEIMTLKTLTKFLKEKVRDGGD